MSTADAILNTLQSHGLADEGGGKYRCDSPLRAGSNSHAFCLKIDGPEHGTWYDQVSGEKGSLYELAALLGIPTPSAAQHSAAPTKRGYVGLDDYAQAHGVPAGVYARWGWVETTRDGRPALEFPTANGPRWRFIDGKKPPFTSPAGYTPCWYGLGEAATLAQASGQPLVLCNGEASVVAAQHYGVASASITNSGERALPPNLLAQLHAAWSGAILIALDCDQKGRGAAPKLAAQLGQHAQIVDLGGSDGFDLADFCRLHGPTSIAELQQRAQPQQPAAPVVVLATVSARIMAALTQLGYTFRLNLLADEIEVNGAPITDVLRAQMRTALRDRDVRPLGAVEDVYTVEAAQRAYHPIKAYLDSLTWDGKDHIAALCGYLTSSDAPIVYPSGGTAPLHSIYIYRWLIGAVAKIYEQAQNLMLVLVGAQGLGKSELPRWLCHKLPAYHLEAPIAVGDKDTDIRLMTRWIWEVSELDATTRKADVAALKDFITRQDVTVRKPYGHHDIVKPALASLVGTVNDGEGFLADPTGNRRFLVTTITTIDWAYTTLDVDQIWAEAVARYRQGEPWRLLPNELQAQTDVNRQHEVGDPIEGWLEKHFWFDPANDPIGMTTADIIDHLRSKEVPINADRSWETRIGAALRRRGLVKAQSRSSGRVRRYIGVLPR